jgi:hypothetical protein
MVGEAMVLNQLSSLFKAPSNGHTLLSTQTFF